MTRRLIVGLLLIAGLLATLTVMPQAAKAGVSGQEDPWSVNFGTDPGELFNPWQVGVDPVDGSVYTLSVGPDLTEVQIDKFSASGAPEGTVSISAAPEEPGASEIKGFVGIAVDHALGRFYVVQSEFGLQSTPSAPIATKVLVFSTEPQAGVLVPAATPFFTLPAANGSETILWPNELHVDPSNHDLVLSAVTPTEHPILRRISSAGALGAYYEETGTNLHERHVGGLPGELRFGFDVGSDGTTYIVADSGTETSSANHAIEAFTLPPAFAPATLSPLSGFSAAATAEGWRSNPNALLLTPPAPSISEGFGPQVALATSSDGEETLFWKGGLNEEPRTAVRIHGYSLRQGGTTAVYGGGPLNNLQECSIETKTATLAPTTNGNLVVLDPGESVESGSPSWGPNVLRFGPGGSGCPGPAPSIKFKSGSTDVTEVAAGTNVTLDASESEIEGVEPSELIWEITKEGGSTETLPAVIGSPAPLELAHLFAEEGHYTVQLTMETTPDVPFIGHGFVAKPKVLVVNAGATTHSLTINQTGTGHGTVECEIDSAAAAPCPTTVEDGKQVTVIGTPDAGSELGTVSGTGSAQAACTTMPCTFTITEDSAVNVEFPLAAGGPTDQLTINQTGTGHGTVECEIESAAAAPCPNTVEEGKQVKVIETPDGGSELGSVSGTGSAGSCSTLPCTFTITADSTVSVEWKPQIIVVKHKLTITPAGEGSGKVQCDSGACATEYPQGSEVTLSAIADPGSEFAGWEGGGCSGTGSCTVAVGAANVNVIAKFSKVPTSSGTNPNSNGGNDSGGNHNSPQPTPTPPSNTVKAGSVTPSGTMATLTVTVPGPGMLAGSGKGVVATKVHAKGAGPVQLKLKLTGSAKKKLAKKGKVIIKVKVVFTPVGGSPGTTTKTITFSAKKKHQARKRQGSAAASSLTRLLSSGAFL